MEVVYISFAVGITIAAIVVWMWLQWQHNRTLQIECRRLERELQAYEDVEHPFATYNESLQQVKQVRQDEIVAYIQDHGLVQTGEVADAIDVSRRTALRYLTELVDDGRIEQVGEVGRSVQYQVATS